MKWKRRFVSTIKWGLTVYPWTWELVESDKYIHECVIVFMVGSEKGMLVLYLKKKWFYPTKTVVKGGIMSKFLWHLESSREAQMSARSSEVWQKRSSPVRVQKRGRREHSLLTLCFNLIDKCDIALIYRMSTNQILIDWLYQSHF